MATQFESLITALVDGGVEFILVGGLAGAAHGSARATQDVDVVYARTPSNIRAVVRALSPHSPYLRGAPPGLPFVFDEETVRRGMNFTLVTALGDIDLLGEITGGGNYSDLLGSIVVLELFGRDCPCLDLDTLISVKRAAGRPKDLEAIAELEMIRDHAKEAPPSH
ncbi:MAG: hypothetical protein AAFX94_06075 [Myxococcota bacterium]